MKITIDKIKELGPCYTEQLEKIAGNRQSMTLMEILVLDIPASHRVWVVSQFLPENSRVKFAESCAERAIRTAYAGASAAWQKWADRWLSGEYRTAARAASNATMAASNATWSAARAVSWAASSANIAASSANAAWTIAWAAEVETQIRELKELARGK